MEHATHSEPLTDTIGEIVGTLHLWSTEGPPRNPRKAAGDLASELQATAASCQAVAKEAIELRARNAASGREVVGLQSEKAQLLAQTAEMQADKLEQEAIVRAEAERLRAGAVALQTKLVANAVVQKVELRLKAEEALTGVQAKVANHEELLDAARQDATAYEQKDRVQTIELQQLREQHTALCAQVRESVPPVSVMCRMRPLESYADGGVHKSALTVDINEITLEDGGRGRKFKVDRVMDGAASQEEVFGAAAPWVESIASGGSSCVFAYGATGSGKTHTLQGSASREGLAHHALRRILEGPHGANVRISMVEVYNDQIRDLLVAPVGSNSGPTVLQCSRRDAQGNMALDCVELVAEQFSQANEILQRGYAVRATDSTLCNEQSSRSHIVVTVHRVPRVTSGVASAASRGRLVLVDLAGSENVHRSGAADNKSLLVEAQAINKSLSALADVVEAIAKRQTFVPYRNAKLTMLLEESFKTAKVLMLLHVSQLSCDVSNTGHSLAFGGRVRSTDFVAQVLRKDQEERLKSACQRSSDENRKLQSQNEQLRTDFADAQKNQQDMKKQLAQITEQLRETQRELKSEKELRSRREAAVRQQESQRGDYKSGSTSCPLLVETKSPRIRRSTPIPSRPQRDAAAASVVAASTTTDHGSVRTSTAPNAQTTGANKPGFGSVDSTIPGKTEARLAFVDITNNCVELSTSKADVVDDTATKETPSKVYPSSTVSTPVSKQPQAQSPAYRQTSPARSLIRRSSSVPAFVSSTNPLTTHNGVHIKSALKQRPADFRAEEVSLAAYLPQHQKVVFSDEVPLIKSPPKWYLDQLAPDHDKRPSPENRRQPTPPRHRQETEGSERAVGQQQPKQQQQSQQQRPRRLSRDGLRVDATENSSSRWAA